MSASDETDAELVARALAGRQAGYAKLMQRHGEAVYRLVRNHLRDEAEALDVTQECFVAAFAALHRYDPARPLRGWLLRIALNKCRDWARKRSVRAFFTFARPLEEAAGIAESEPDPEAILSSAQEVERLRAAIAALPLSLKEPLLLCAIEGIAQDEAASILGVSRKTVETRIHRARAKLRLLIEE